MNLKRVIFAQLILVLTAVAESQKATVRLARAVATTTKPTDALRLLQSRRRHRRLEGAEVPEGEGVDADDTSAAGNGEGGAGNNADGGDDNKGEEVIDEGSDGDSHTGNEGNVVEGAESEQGGDQTPDGGTETESAATPETPAEGVDSEPTSKCEASECSKCLELSDSLTRESEGVNACQWDQDRDIPCYEVVDDDGMENNACDASEDSKNEQPEQEDSGTSASTEAPTDGDKSGGNGDDDEGGGGGFFFGLVLLAFIGGAVYFIRKKLMLGGGVEKIKDIMEGSSSVFMSHGSSVARSGTKYENVPLTSSDDDEEWGWEDGSDSNGDIELPKKEETKPDFGRTQSSNSSSSRSGSNQLIPAMSKSSPVTSRPTRTLQNSTASDWSEPTRPVVTPLASPSLSPTVPTVSPPVSGNMPGMPLKITSLGSTSRPGGVTKKKKKPVSKPEDDLFASMGLSAKPSFPTSKPTTTTTTTKPPTASAGPSWKATDSNVSPSADWDDADLDDLLDD